MTTPRGIRNHNLGNIDLNPRFARFDQAENGIRALGKLLLNYRGKDGMPGVGRPGIDTPLEFISRWAPSSENNTLAYVKAIAKRLGVGVCDSIDISKPQVLREAVLGIIVHENGSNPYKAEVIGKGVRRALPS